MKRTVVVGPDDTVAQGFEALIRSAFPGGIPPHQRFDLWQFYMAGALQIFAAIEKHAELPEDEACKKMDAMQKDLLREAGLITATNQMRMKAGAAGHN